MTTKMTPTDLRECLLAFWDAKRHRFRELTRYDAEIRCVEHFENARVMAGARGWMTSRFKTDANNLTVFCLTPEGEAFTRKIMAIDAQRPPERRLTCNPAYAATHVAKKQKATLRHSYGGV